MNECLTSAQDNLCIQSVNLNASKIYTRDDLDLICLDQSETKSQTYRGIKRTNVRRLVDAENNVYFDYRFIYRVGIRLIYIRDEKNTNNPDFKPIIEIIGTFEAIYFSQKELNKKELEAFSEINVGYHVWPFWREYAQSTCARIGLSPSFEIPFYIARKKKKMRKKRTAS